MDAFKISTKLFATQDVFGPAEFLPIFQHWIQNQSLADHLLIDVADYAHVVAGPGTALVSSQANLATDRGEHRLGLLYTRKLPLDGNFRDRLAQVAQAALTAAIQLEQEPTLSGRLKFRTNELLIRINDRLLAPNTPETFANVQPDLLAFGESLYGAGALTIEHKASPLTLFEARIKTVQSPPIAALLEHLSARPVSV
jgi:hypothetical protein